MYPQIITYLLTFIKYQEQIIRTLLTLLIGKGMFESPPKNTDKPVNLPYQKLQIDELPLIQKLEKLDYRVLLQEHLDQTGKAIKPVQRRRKSTPVPSSFHCPKCGAPSDYLYANNGKNGQYLCKVCG